MRDFVSVALEQHACCASVFSPADDSEHQSLGPNLSADQACGFPLIELRIPLKKTYIEKWNNVIICKSV